MPDSKNPLLQTLLNLVGDPNTITVHRAVVDFLDGHFEAALLLEQLLYWTPKASRRGGWIAKSYTEWREEIYLTRYAIEKARKYLQKRGLLEWEIRRFKNSPTAFYRLNLDALAAAWKAFLVEQGEMEPLDEDVTEGESASESQPETTEAAPAEINRWSEEAKKAPAEIDRCPEEPPKAPAEISKCSDKAPKAPAEISKCSDKAPKAPAEISKPPAEIDKSPAEISKCLTEITTEITQLSINARLQQQASTKVNRGGTPRTPAVAAAAKLPPEIRDALHELGWVGDKREVLAAWEQDPDRLRAWIAYVRAKGGSGGLLRKLLREEPGYPPAEPDPFADWADYAASVGDDDGIPGATVPTESGGDGADAPIPAELPLLRRAHDAPAATPLAGDRKAPGGNGDGKPKMWDDEGGTQPPRPDIGALPPPTPDMRRWWAFAVGQIRAEMPKADFDAWLRPTRLVARRGDDDRLVFVAATANAYAQRWLTERVSKILERKLAGLAGRPVAVQFVVLENAHV